MLNDFQKIEGIDYTPSQELKGFGNIRLPDLNVKPWSQNVSPISLRDSFRSSTRYKESTYSLPEIENPTASKVQIVAPSEDS
jgi:hypothetical protein